MSEAERSAADSAATSPVTALRWCPPDVSAAPGAGHGPLTAKQLEQIEEQARSEGYSQGLQEGRKAGAEAVRREAARLQQLLDSIGPSADLLDDDFLGQIAELVIVLTGQLVRRNLSIEPGEVVRVVREAMAALPVSEARIRIYLNPEDAELVRRELHLDAIERPLEVMEEVGMSRGGARVETDSSVVDASVESQIRTLAASVFGIERQESPARGGATGNAG